MTDTLPHWDCPNPDCRAFNGTAKVDHVTCRCCGTPRPFDIERTMLENLTSVQTRCTELKLENRELRTLLVRWYMDRDAPIIGASGLYGDTDKLLRKLGLLE